MRPKLVSMVSLLFVLVLCFAAPTVRGLQCASDTSRGEYGQAGDQAAAWYGVSFLTNYTEEPTLTVTVNITYVVEISQVALVYSIDSGSEANQTMDLVCRSTQDSIHSSVWKTVILVPYTQFEIVSKLWIQDSNGTNWEEELGSYAAGLSTSVDGQYLILAGSSLLLVVSVAIGLSLCFAMYQRFRAK